MKTKNLSCSSLNSWIDVSKFSTQECSANEFEWLTNPASLTDRLRRLNPDIKHSLIKYQQQNPLAEELAIFSFETRSSHFWIREITWEFQREIWIIGRVLIPEKTLQVNAAQLEQGQHRPIGEILFSQHQNAKRLNIEIQKLTAPHPYYQQALHLLTHRDMTIPEAIFCRRSLFAFHEQPLLIVEMFLPQFFSSIATLPTSRATAECFFK